MSDSVKSRPIWFGWASVTALVVGAVSLTVYFLTIPSAGPANPWTLLTLILLPHVSGVIGAVFGALARKWWLLGLNTLLAFSFPLLMFFGTLILGP